MQACMAKPPDNLEQIVRNMAVEVGATEAAGFAVEPNVLGGTRVTPLIHFRPDESDDATRTAALAAFKEILTPWVQKAKDAVIEIDGSDNGAGTQFCLVTLARHAEKVVGASTFIVRCRDRQDAQSALMRAQFAAADWPEG